MCYCEALLVFNMVQRITNIIKDYQERLRELPYVPTTSFRRDSLVYPSDANIGIQFLKDVGLIRSKVQCNSCGLSLILLNYMASGGDVLRLYSCSFPGGGGISLFSYATVVICRCATNAMFSSSPLNTHIALARMTVLDLCE